MSIRALYVKPKEKAQVIEIEDSLDAMKEAVGGWIQMVVPQRHKDDAVVICNEEGKLDNLTLNRKLETVNGDWYDTLCGNFLVVKAPVDGEDFEFLTDEQIERYTWMYNEESIML